MLGTADCLLIYVLLRPQSGVLLATVPVSVDAIAFWMVWDAQKAVLEVEAFMHAVVLSPQTRGMTATTRWTRGPAPTFAAAARVLLPPSRLQSGRVTRHPNRGAQGPLAPRPPGTLLRSPSGLPPHRTRPMLRQRSRSAIDTPGPSPLLKEKLRKTGCRLSA